jgi:hypothetical protein
MRRALFVVAAGLIGLLLGVGLSLAADAIAGSHLSEPVPLRIQTDATSSPAPHATGSEDHDRPNRHDDSDGASPSETPSPRTTTGSAIPTTSPTSGEDHSHDSSGEHDPSSAEDD